MSKTTSHTAARGFYKQLPLRYGGCRIRPHVMFRGITLFIDRTVRFRVALLVLISSSLIAPQAYSATAPQNSPETVSSDSPRTTPGGATFTVPSGWSIASGPRLAILQPPESDTHVVIFDAQAGNAKAAVESAWATYKPDFKRPLKLVTPRPPHEGWEERQVFDYETSPNERAVVEALALRAGTAWTVLILDGTEPTVEKRSAPINLVFGSIRPKGYQREIFAGRQPHPLDASRIAQTKEFVQNSMQQLGVPGVSLALMDHGKIVYEGGLGVRELGKPEKVDQNTLFMAASNTKGMTTLLLAELVDEKKLRWDQPVIEVYPAFKLGDADTTKKSSGQEFDLRLHRTSAPGSGVVVRIQERYAGLRVETARNHAADQQVWRSFPVQQSDGYRRRLHWRAPGVPRSRSWRCLRQRNAGKDF